MDEGDYFVRSGFVYPANSSNLYRATGSSGRYWSSTPYSSSASSAYTLLIGSVDYDTTVYPSYSHPRYNGYPLRCLARE